MSPVIKLNTIWFSIHLLHGGTFGCKFKLKYDVDTPVSHFKNIHLNYCKDKTIERSYNVSDLWEWVDYFSYQVPCGTMVNDPSSAIMGGKDAPDKSWPWQVRVFYGDRSCGGVLIDAQWVLTTAHCVEENGPYNIILGTRYYGPAVAYVTRRSKVIAAHEEYSPHFLDNDIALLKMSSNVTYSDRIRPACLPMYRQEFSVNDNCYVTGFGNRINTKNSLILQQLRVYVVPDVECAYLMKLNFKRTDWSNICAGRVRQTAGGVCFGDSGGPLSCKSIKKYYVAGLTSENPGNCNSDIIPDLFMKVSEYISWIVYTVDKFRNA
ncbi:Transmembrane protease serine 13 [Bulinus truncatus]|nr:Transmembrane protease serine 13 [Bulinus truncatus]